MPIGALHVHGPPSHPHRLAPRPPSPAVRGLPGAVHPPAGPGLGGDAPPDLVAPVDGEIRVRIKRGSAAADHRVAVIVDRAANGKGWTTISLPRLSGTNSKIDTGIQVKKDDRLTCVWT
ncbi:MAG: hypothetical protein IPL60_15740 [Ardenticatenia bacterium]|nr:hypothetical protein [Ardenticatenia bacterium]